jgi:hypothetical protein
MILFGSAVQLKGCDLPIVLFEEAVDRGLQIGDGAKDAALEAALCEALSRRLRLGSRRA